jgi:hypothetical protein
LMTEKNVPASRAISMAMRIMRYGAKRIAQYGRSRATLDATGRRHGVIIRPVFFGGCHGHRFWRTKRTLYSAHRSDKLRRKIEHHD